MKILILGYYNCNNLGDDMFVTAYRQLLNNHQLTFSNICEIDNCVLQNYEIVIVGSGDLFNDYFATKYNDKLSSYNGYKLALGVGTSYEECLNRDYINYFDDIYIRNTRDLKYLNRKIGSLNVGYIPDLLFSLQLDINKKSDANTIGFFLVGSMLKNKTLLFNICTFINYLILSKYNIELISMCYDIADNDLLINMEIYNMFQSTGQIKLHNRLNEQAFLNVFNHLDFAFCVRFHSHVFCTRYAIPFISLPLTRKNQLFLEDLPQNTQYALQVKRNDNYDVIAFDNYEVNVLFSNLVTNAKEISNSLSLFNILQENFYKTNKIQNLINNKRKRIINTDRIFNIDWQNIYEKYINLILSYGVNPLADNLIDYFTKEQIDMFAKSICYDLTLNIDNEYVIGTSHNLENKNIQLKDIIKWIYYDNYSKLNLDKLNINYLYQNKFSNNQQWQEIINKISYLCNNFGTYLDTNLFNTFGDDSFILENDALLPYTNRWIGFFPNNNLINEIKNIFNKNSFLQSLKLCKGLLVLDENVFNEVKTLLKYSCNENIKLEYLNCNIDCKENNLIDNIIKNFLNSRIYIEL
jgi:polysaccharide pyruvyl transferase WcaK-like protein